MGGGCCHSVPAETKSDPDIRAYPPTTTGGELPSKELAPPVDAEFETAFQSDTKQKMADMEEDKNFSVDFFTRNLEVLCKRTAYEEGKDDCALILLRKVLNRIYLSCGSGTQIFTAKEATRLRGLLSAYTQKVSLPSLLATEAALIQQGIAIVNNTRVSGEAATKLQLALQVLLGNNRETPDWLQEKVDGEFFDSVKAEIYLQLARSESLQSAKPLLEILLRNVRADTPYTYVLISNLTAFLMSLSAWNPVLESLFYGTEGIQGLCVFLLNDHNKPLADACLVLFQTLLQSPVAELRAIAEKALADRNKPKASFLILPMPDPQKSGAKCALVAEITVPSFKIIRNEIFHTRARIVLTSARSITVTGIPSADGKSRGCAEVDLEREVITTLPSLLKGRYWHTASFFQGQIIVAGGKSSKKDPSLTSVEVYGAKNGAWVAMRDLNLGRDSHSDCVTGGCLYLFGGVGETDKAATIEKLAGGNWTLLLVQMPLIVGTLAVGALNSEEVVLAGGSSARDKLCLRFNLSTGASSELTELPDGSVFVSGMYKMHDGHLVVLTVGHALLRLDITETGSAWVELGRHSS